MLNKKLYIIFSFILLWGCGSRNYFILKDSNFYLKDECEHQKNLKQSTRNKLFRNRITLSKKTAVHIQILFHGKENRCIVLINCNGGFQDERYLGFYDGHALKVIQNSFDLDLLYEEYLSFCKQNNPDDRDKIWNYIDSFSRTELLNHYNKINF